MFMFVNIGTHVFLFANKKAAAQLPGAILPLKRFHVFFTVQLFR